MTSSPSTHRSELFGALLVLLTCALAACSSSEAASTGTSAEAAQQPMPEQDSMDDGFKISLAQWSLHRRYREEGGDPYKFADHAKELGFSGIEYVSQLYNNDIRSGEEHAGSVMSIMERLGNRADEVGVTEVLIMIDGEGSLGDKDEQARTQAVEQHRHWIDAASMSDIPTIRVNAAGEGSRSEVAAQAVKSLSELGKYGAQKNVNVVVENHGGYSSDPQWLHDVMATVDMDNVGILPDFGNFCRAYKGGNWANGCADAVPSDSIYAAVGMWMPFAHAVSAKSHDFNDDGQESEIDYDRMMDTVLAHGYHGFVGVEYEGSELSEVEGIEATRKLLLAAGGE